MAALQQYHDVVENIFKAADIELDGKRPFDIKVNNNHFYKRLLKDGKFGFCESYVEGWWDSDKLDDTFTHVYNTDADKMLEIQNFNFFVTALRAKISPEGTNKRSKEIGEKHYDLGNDLFEAMLGKYKMYSCGYWRYAKNLNEAQHDKLKLIAKKLHLKKGMRVLDVGCGWSELAKYLAEHHDVEVVGITVSKEQLAYGKELCKHLGKKVDLRYQDYRDINEQFDRIVSVGMFEHVGKKFYNTFMQSMAKCLKDDGLFLLHTIGNNTSNFNGQWITKYIFPGGYIPSIAELSKSMEGIFVLEDLHNFGADYDKTLMAWYKNFIKAWPKLQGNYSDHFFRMWKLYLNMCAAHFRARDGQLWQIVLTKNGIPGGYHFDDNYII